MKRSIKILIAVAVIIFSLPSAIAQPEGDETLLYIADDSVSVDDFLYVYNKNNPNTEDVDQNDLNEYLDLYINFRLKVKEAREMGLDTAEKFKKELEGYRKQLAQPYFKDQEMEDMLLKQAYERKLIDVRASHILVRIGRDASPEDTLAAYDKIIMLRNRVLDGEDFGTVAEEASEDPSARDTPGGENRPARKGNKGDLGYFTVFDMVYPFENGAYTTMVDEISMPLRSDYGYHLIYVTDRQPALGQVQVAHIYVANPKDDSEQAELEAKQKIDSAYQKLLAGAEWNELVLEYSEDRGSAAKEGILPWFGANRMVPEFIVVVRKLEEPGKYSEPVKTTFGWHIIKLIEQKPVGSFEDEKTNLHSRLVKDSRYQLTEDVIVNRIKKEYNFTEYPEALEAIIPVVDSSIFSAEWDPESAAGLTEPVFILDNNPYTQYEFAKYMASKQNRRIGDIRLFMNDQYKWYVEESCTQYENDRLEAKYPEFRMLVREYYDGILLFELTDQKVWSKAGKDTTGLKLFYEGMKTENMWGERIDASVFTILDDDKVNIEELKKMLQNNIETDSIIKYINTTSDIANAKPKPVIQGERDKFERGSNHIVDIIKWKKGFAGPVSTQKGTGYAYVYQVLKPQPKELNEVRGLVTAEYQNYLEKEWIQELREKYPVTVKEEILLQIK